MDSTDKMKKVLLHIVIIIFMAGFVQAQQDPNYTQYMFNPLNYNPAYAGSNTVLSAALVYRNQWVGINGAPKIVTFSSSSPLKNKNMGVGFEITSDKIGPVKNLRIQGSYAYRIKVSRIDKGMLGFGLKAGIFRSSYDWTKISYKDGNDVLTGIDQTSKTVPIFDAGIYYHRMNKMFVGASLINLNNPNIDQSVSSDAEASRQYTNVVLTYGKIIEFNDRVIFRPSFLFQYSLNSKAPPLLDINMSLLFDGVFWAGLSYRTSSTIAAVFKYEISHQFQIGYSYDYYLGELSKYSNGAHEIFLGFNYNVFKSRMRSPRYYF